MTAALYAAIRHNAAPVFGATSGDNSAIAMHDSFTAGFTNADNKEAGAAAFEAWLRAQRELLDRWLSGNAADEAQRHAQEQVKRWWQDVTQHVSPAAQGLAQQLAALGPSVLAGTASSLNELFGVHAASSEALFDFAPVGFFRDHQAHWQNLARAFENQRRLAQQMSGVIAQVHGDALERLAVRIAELEQQGERITTTRRLYDVWIECGERAFTHTAHQDAYARLLGELTRANLEVRAAQQILAEYLLKQLDLPTRAELNTVHRSLRSLRDRIEVLEGKSIGTGGANDE
jgi:class III poly(R)-hydroxyalkanoic acid synthase PhaE subunit